jgi:hypothetical protein
MWILRLVRNFALLAVLALAAHTAAGRGPQCFGQACGSTSCSGGCACSASYGCVRNAACKFFGDCLLKH